MKAAIFILLKILEAGVIIFLPYGVGRLVFVLGLEKMGFGSHKRFRETWVVGLLSLVVLLVILSILWLVVGAVYWNWLWAESISSWI